MKTDELIAALSADTRRRGLSLSNGWWVAVALAALAAALAYASMLAPRPDIAAVAMTARFLFKFLFAGALAGAAFASSVALSRPGVGLGATLWLLVAPALLAVAVVLELVSVPAAEWGPRLIGRNSMACLIFIPTIGLVPLVVFIAALRRGAPSHPVLAGGLRAAVGRCRGAVLCHPLPRRLTAFRGHLVFHRGADPHRARCAWRPAFRALVSRSGNRSCAKPPL